MIMQAMGHHAGINLFQRQILREGEETEKKNSAKNTFIRVFLSQIHKTPYWHYMNVMLEYPIWPIMGRPFGHIDD